MSVMRRITDLPAGHFTLGEVSAAGTKADVAVCLRNGLVLLIECKVSNSGTNSIKRLNHEVGDKIGKWRDLFGRQACTVAVLAGVYNLVNLEAAQDAGISIFFQYDLGPLREFIEASV